MKYYVKILFLLCFLSSTAWAEEHDTPKLELSLFTGISLYDAPQNSYLGTQTGGGLQQYDLFVSDPEHEFNTYGGEVSFKFSDSHLSNQNSFFKHFNSIKLFSLYEQSITEHNQYVGLIDPAGDTLLVPTPDGDAFSLTAPNNEITGARFFYDYEFYNVDIGIKGDLKSNYKKIKLSPFAHISYTQTQSDTALDGSIPFFFRDFDYYTKIKVQTLSPTIGFDASYKIFPKLDLSVGGNYAYNINRGRGRDSLNFTGFGRRTTSMHNNRHTHSIGLKSDITYDITPSLALNLEAKYDLIGNAPSMDTRRNGKRSDFTYKSTDVISGSVRAMLKF